MTARLSRPSANERALLIAVEAGRLTALMGSSSRPDDIRSISWRGASANEFRARTVVRLIRDGWLTVGDAAPRQVRLTSEGEAILRRERDRVGVSGFCGESSPKTPEPAT